MLALKSSARRARLGIWGHPFYAVIAPVQAAQVKGRWLRDRGLLNKRNGPMIVATYPEQIELLAD